MSPNTVMRRGRALASFSAVLGLCLGSAALVPGPAQSAAVAGDCTAPFPVADLHKGDAVTGLTVSKGTAPEGFDGEVLGVLEDGIAPGLDMVMVELSSPAIDEVGGIWQGMSGSPVYAADGRLIGAVAYGLSWGPTPVAGVTPFEEMDNYLDGAAPKSIKVDRSTARSIASRSEVTQAQAAEGFAQIPMPTGVSGVGARRLSQVTKVRGHKWMPRTAYATGTAAAPGAGAGPETIVAGGNLAGSLSYGDITLGGVGTATSVCNDRVVGFGHPFGFFGDTTLTLHPADALFVQPESLGPPFKVANLGAPAGTITDDHLAGITGLFGAAPATTDLTSSVTFRDRHRVGASHVSVPQGTAMATFFQQIANHDRVVDGIIPGSELLSWTIAGRGADGSPFELAVTDRYASDYDITIDAVWELADFVWALSAVPGVSIDSVTADSAVIDDASRWKVSRVEQYRAGEWTKVGKGSPVLARPGKPVKLQAVLKGSGGTTTTVPLVVDVPDEVMGSRGRLMVTGGSYMWSRNSWPRSVAQAEKYVATLVRNDQVSVELSMPGRRGSSTASQVSDPTDKVVEGRRAVKVVVR